MPRSASSGVVTVNDVLDGHTVLDLSCLDRLYLSGLCRAANAWRVVYFLHEHWGMPIASPRCSSRSVRYAAIRRGQPHPGGAVSTR